MSREVLDAVCAEVLFASDIYYYVIKNKKYLFYLFLILKVGILKSENKIFSIIYLSAPIICVKLPITRVKLK